MTSRHVASEQAFTFASFKLSIQTFLIAACRYQIPLTPSRDPSTYLDPLGFSLRGITNLPWPLLPRPRLEA